MTVKRTRHALKSATIDRSTDKELRIHKVTKNKIILVKMKGGCCVQQD